MGKKQIVFVEPKLVVSTYKIARTLRITDKYETVLVCYSKTNKEFIKKGFDKVIGIQGSLLPNYKNIKEIVRRITDPKTYKSIREIRELRPYIVQVRGPSLDAWASLLLARKSPRVFYLYDIWQYYRKKRASRKKKSGILQMANAFFEKMCIKNSDAVLNKCGEGSLKSLSSNIKVPILDFLPYCHDEWLLTPKKKSIKKDDIHIVYAGTIWDRWEGHASFPEMIEKIISQKIHLHLYPSIEKKKIFDKFREIQKRNKYFHLYENVDEDKINNIVSKYDYAIHLDFYDNTISPLWTETGMSAKIFGYIEAGLPIIINKQFRNMCRIIEDNKVGFGITYEELGKLKEIILKRNYPNTKTIKKAQDNLRISKKIKLLEDFYEKIHNLNNTKF